MVDLFSAAPCTTKVDISANKAASKILFLNKAWERIISECWIVGYAFENLSKRSLSNFGIVLSYGSDFFTPTGSSFTRVFVDSSLSDMQSSSQKRRRTNANSKFVLCTANDVVGPGAKFTVTARYPLHLFCNVDKNHGCYSAAVVVTCDSAAEETCTVNQFIFHVGKVSITATEIANKQLSLTLDNLLSSQTDMFMDDLRAVQACHTYQNIFLFSSEATDVITICQELLVSVDFMYCRSLNMHLCTSPGMFYLMLLKLHPITKTQADVEISSKSEFEALLLFNYFREQVTKDFKITPREFQSSSKPAECQEATQYTAVT